MASSAAPLNAAASPALTEPTFEQALERPRDFHFAVTWVTLFAHLDLIESPGPRRRIENAAPTLALVPVVASAPLVDQLSHRESGTAWEMVVPRMIRSGSGNFAPAEDGLP